MTTRTDREFLELAAKAAGYETTGEYDGLGIWACVDGAWRWWYPRTDDGDEARLEAALGLHVIWHPLSQTVSVGKAGQEVCEPWGEDLQAARRRAGVRAAAEIGAKL